MVWPGSSRRAKRGGSSYAEGGDLEAAGRAVTVEQRHLGIQRQPGDSNLREGLGHRQQPGILPENSEHRIGGVEAELACFPQQGQPERVVKLSIGHHHALDRHVSNSGRSLTIEQAQLEPDVG